MINPHEFEGLSFDDVLLVPQKGIVDSRSDVDLGTHISNRYGCSIPIVSAPMSSVTDGFMALAMWEAGAYGIIHRFMSPTDQAREYGRNVPVWSDGDRDLHYAGASLGLNEGLSRYFALRAAGCKVFVIDVAHGHHDKVARLIDEIRTRHDHVDVIAGNVATAAGARFLLNAGAAGVKVGIGPGSACTTRSVTGFGVPQLTAIQEVSDEVGMDVPVIADGGIKSSGDIVKALAAGASSVMLGKLLAGAQEAPKPGEYYGAASVRAMHEQEKDDRAPEGVEGIVPIEGPVKNIIDTLAQGIRSGMSYGGAKNIWDLQQKAQWIRVAPGVAAESHTRLGA